ncbi:MAG: shikimate kinase [Clostridiales bacterium]|jgi:shikimate kinase|nr:shikimate kinase [Clostridiales bacterium]
MLHESKTVVLTGMPGVGKTTVGRILSDGTGRPWFDSDAEIERAEGMSVSDIFALKGEGYFRGAERETLRRLAAVPGAVISAGGGASVADIKRPGVAVVLLRRPLLQIRAALEDGSRPLLREPGSLERLYAERRGRYEAEADLAVDIISPELAAEAIRKALGI